MQTPNTKKILAMHKKRAGGVPVVPRIIFGELAIVRIILGDPAIVCIIFGEPAIYEEVLADVIAAMKAAYEAKLSVKQRQIDELQRGRKR